MAFYGKYLAQSKIELEREKILIIWDMLSKNLETGAAIRSVVTVALCTNRW
jgi:hypothetical protein